MRLLSSLLLLALAVSSSLALPCTRKDPCNPEPPKTTIETFYETVTRTEIHEVTDPSEPCDEEEPSYEGLSNEERLKQLEEELAKVNKEIKDRTPKTPCPAATSAPEEVTVTDATEEATTPAADFEGGTIRKCSCDEANNCRKESDAEMGTCMESCKQELVNCGDNTEEHLACFKENTAILEAEKCLFNETQYCATGCKDTTDVVDWSQYTNISYAPAEDSELKENYLWKQHGAKYTKVQNFFHCTKNCMHRKFHSCTEAKECDIEMPSPSEFSDKMQTCLKKNYKIANSMLTTCQCLAWKNSVKTFQGACVIIGNQYYIDRV